MKALSENKKAYYNYEILEKFEAGLVLIGQEVKSIKLGRMSLAGSFVVFRGKEPYLIGAKVPPYQPKNAGINYNQEREKKLLLNETEINYLLGKTHQKGLTLTPIKVYTKNGIIKLEFALARGKKKYDKREKIKSREAEKEISSGDARFDE